ncbi:MAG: serine hydrolase domain-containing protein [Bacteroidota bacterium]
MAATITCSCSTKTYFGRWMTWRASDIKDHEKFPSHQFKASSSPYFFVKSENESLASLVVTSHKGKRAPIQEVLRRSGTTAFLVIQNDTLVYENYFNGYDRSSVNTSFSVAKSVTSLMIGKAIDDGVIHSVNDPVVQYLPELRALNGVTLDYLLNMRSGIQFKDHDLPWGDKPKAYYHPRLRQRIGELNLKRRPGTRFQYNSYNPIIVGMVLERVTCQSPAQYFESKIWSKLGMEYDGSWSMDSRASGMTKMESGLNIRPIDFAKIGRLILNRGRWNTEEVVSENWIANLYKISDNNGVKDFGSGIHYEKFWWLFSNGSEQAYIISGWGHLGQYLYIFPKEKIIIVRMGKSKGRIDSWKTIFTELVDHLER